MKPALLLAALPALALSGCITYHTVNDGITRARMGETVRVGAMMVTPQSVIEDSRCPTGTQCVWAGRVRIVARVDGADAELVLGEAKPLAQGRLTLVEVYPAKPKDSTLYPDEYRFGFSATAQQ
jgi:outer membrane lipoprotein SlyB